MAEIIYRDDAVAFLDIDGIAVHDLQTRRHATDPVEFPSTMDPKCVDRLVELQQKYRFKYVLSSSMRIIYKSIDAFKDAFAVAGADKLVFHDDWRTPSHVPVHPGSEASLTKWCRTMGRDVDVNETIHWRGHQIKEWLVQHPQVSSYLSIDDSPDFYPLEPEQCLWIRYGLAEGGIAHFRQDIVDKAFEHNFTQPTISQEPSVLEDMQRALHGSQILETLMGGFMPDETWLKSYIKFQDAVKILMRGYLNITPEEMEFLKELVREEPAFLMVVAGHYKFNINFTPATETE